MSSDQFQVTEAIAAAKVVDDRAVLIRGIEDNPDPKFALVRLAGFGIRVTYLKPGGVTESCEGTLISADAEGVTLRLNEEYEEQQNPGTPGELSVSWESLGLIEIF